MSRNNTQVLNNIRMLCRIQKVNEKMRRDLSRVISANKDII